MSETYWALRLTGRCADGAERDGGRVFHAVPIYWPGPLVDWKAMCRAHPGRMSAGWSDHRGGAVTCPRCLKKLAALSRRDTPGETPR